MQTSQPTTTITTEIPTELRDRISRLFHRIGLERPGGTIPQKQLIAEALESGLSSIERRYLEPATEGGNGAGEPRT